MAGALLGANLLAQQPAPAPLVMSGTNVTTAAPASEKPADKAAAKPAAKNGKTARKGHEFARSFILLAAAGRNCCSDWAAIAA